MFRHVFTECNTRWSDTKRRKSYFDIVLSSYTLKKDKTETERSLFQMTRDSDEYNLLELQNMLMTGYINSDLNCCGIKTKLLIHSALSATSLRCYSITVQSYACAE